VRDPPVVMLAWGGLTVMVKSPVTGVTWVTVREKLVVLVGPPTVTPVIVIVNVPVVALGAAVKVTTVEQVGVHVAGENDAVTPAGRPDAVKLTSWLVPESRVAVTVVVVLEPCATDPLVGEAERL
jgi:hypothetical protein